VITTVTITVSEPELNFECGPYGYGFDNPLDLHRTPPLHPVLRREQHADEGDPAH
jgi:hypothetical protein